MRMRDFLGVIVAFVADFVQVGTTSISLGTDQFAVPMQVLFSAAVSVILATLMGPNPRLLPSVVLELIPLANVLPGFTGSAVWIALNNRKLKARGTEKACWPNSRP